MNQTEANKAFIREMIGSKKSLEDFPGRFDPELLMHEPASLPFGGSYKGLTAFQAFYPQVRAFYDFDRFELLGVYGDGEMVFATIKAALSEGEGTIVIAEQFRFEGSRLVEVRLHICDDARAAAALRARSSAERDAPVDRPPAEPSASQVSANRRSASGTNAGRGDVTMR